MLYNPISNCRIVFVYGLSYRLFESVAPPLNCKGATDKVFFRESREKNFSARSDNFVSSQNFGIVPLTIPRCGAGLQSRRVRQAA